MKRIFKTSLKVLLYSLGGIFLLLVCVILALQLESVQNFAVQKSVNYVTGKTNTKLTLQRFFVDFPTKIVLEELFAEDLKHDTLVYVKKLEIDLNIWDLTSGKLSVSELNVDGLTANIHRTLPDSSFNFDFFVQAFASKNPKPTNPAADTSVSTIKIKVDRVHLQRLNLLYDDAVTGMFAKANLGELTLGMDEIDLQKMTFKGKELMLANTTGLFEIRKISEDKPQESSGPLPDIALKKLSLNHVTFGFHQIPDSSFFDFKVGQLNVVTKEIDLNKQRIDLDSILLNQSDIQIAMNRKQTKSEKIVDSSVAESNWMVSAKSIDFIQNQFGFHVTNLPALKSGMDYNHLDVNNISLIASSLFYSSELIKGKISRFELKEKSGFDLRQLQTEFEYDSSHASLENLLLLTSETRISKSISIAYTSLASLASDVGNLSVRANLDSTKIGMKDVLVFAPDLVNQPIIKKNQDLTIAINGELKGKLNDLLATNLDIRTAANTRLALSGRLKGLPNATKLNFDLVLHTLTTSRNDVNQLLPKSMIPTAIRIPDDLSLSGHAKGNLKNLVAAIQLKGSDGQADVQANFSEKSNVPHYSLNLETKQLHVGRIIKQSPMLGRLSANLKIEGESFNPEKMIGQVNGEIQRIELKKYPYQNIQISASAAQGAFLADLNVNDPNLNFQLKGSALLTETESRADVILNLLVANLKDLNLSKEELKVTTKLEAHVQDFDLQKMDAKLKIKDVLFIKSGQKIGLDSLIATMENDSLKHTLVVKSDVLDLDFAGNLSLDKMVPAVQKYLAPKLASNFESVDTTSKRFTFSVLVKPDPLIQEVLLPELKQFSGLSLDAKFNNKEEVLQLNAHSDQVQYGETKVQDINVQIDSKSPKINYEASFLSLKSGAISIPKTTLSGGIEDKITDFNLTIAHPDSGDRLRLEGLVNQKIVNETSIRLTGGNIKLNNETWKINASNAISIKPTGINFQEIGFEQDGQLLKIHSINKMPDAPIDVEFKNFEIGTLSRIIESDTAILRGLINGDVHIKKLTPFAFTSDLNISNIVFREAPIGQLAIEANNLTENRYSAKIALTGDSNDVLLSGNFENEVLDMNLKINRIRMKLLESFASTFIRNTSGYLTGNANINGKMTEPNIKGNITFKQASFNLVPINNQLLLKNETINLDNKGVHFKDFIILDPAGQPMEVDGSILSSDFKNMKFELDVNTKNFKAINTTARDNKAFYGTMILNSLIKIRGDQNLPVVSANAKLLDGSTFTFVVLQGDLSTSRGETVVLFEDSISMQMKAPKDTLKMKTEFKGIDLTANIEVNKNTIFHVIVDPESGDNLEVSGDANLALGIDPSGKVSLSGVYTLNDGHYQASFQNVLKREFKIKPGSQITWSGDPMDGQIDLTAVYKTQAAATDLLASELTGVSETERSAYRKLLNYNVNLIIVGPLLKPKLSFQLDMPPQDQLAFNGLVYSKVQLLNTDPNELNKQVFSLLVLNKFLPTGASQSPGAGEAATTLARNSVNQMLSEQLNAISGKYVKGADLNFNLQTTEDYTGGAAKQNTALQVGLKKELFNSRLTLQVGSSIDLSGNHQSTNNANGQNLSGDVLVEYKLTQDGRFRLKAFRENQYEGIIDGILYKTGLGITFTRDFNYYRDLWRKPAADDQFSTSKPNEN